MHILLLFFELHLKARLGLGLPAFKTCDANFHLFEPLDAP
jgi:hypothetical protein